MRTPLVAAIAAAALASAGPAAALGFPKLGKGRAVAARAEVAPVLAAFDQALSEERLVDAGRILDTAYVGGLDSPALRLRSGELQLRRLRYEDALASFELAAKDPALNALALQGKGLALASLGRSEPALVALEAAVAADASLWRGWNALAVERDRRRDFTAAEAAYGKALAAPGVKPIVLSNRGYSRVLQGRYDEASADLVAALEKDPSLAIARTNLRLTMALRGDYRRATAVSGVEDRATVLNNAGFAAVMRGDYDQAERLFQEAIATKGASYGRAIENLKLVKALRTAEGPRIPE